MKKYRNIMESDISKIVKSLLMESASNVDTIYSAHPGDIDPTIFFPEIIPNRYKREYDGPGGKWWQNSCASKMSMAMAKAGYPVPGGFTTEVVWNGVPKGTTFSPSSQSFTNFFTKTFGKPTFTWTSPAPGTDAKDSCIPKYIKGRKGVFVFKTDQWSDAAGHVDVWNGTSAKGGGEHYFCLPGEYKFWAEPTQLEINTKNCGWGNDSEGYKKSGWRCYDEEMQKKQSCPIINARKCGYKDDVKSYRLSGWKCKTTF